MKYLELSLATPLSYNWCGKFQAPTPEWMHLTRDLLDFELFVVTEGTLYIADHIQEYVLNKGDCLIMSPTPHQHGYKASNCSFYWMHFSPTSPLAAADSGEIPSFYRLIKKDSLPDACPDNHIFLPLSATLAAHDRTIVLMKQLQDCDKRYHNHMLNNSIATAIITEISCQCMQQLHGNYMNEKNQLYNDIADYVSWHICENIKVSEIADYFGYNEKYISTFFHRMSGTPLKQFILQAKMDHAKAELTDTNRTVSQIAYNIGFNDPHNFTNAFKKITGLSPTEYRISYAKRSLFYK